MRRDVEGGGDGGCEEETVSSYSPVNPSYDINSRYQHKVRLLLLTSQYNLTIMQGFHQIFRTSRFILI